MAAKDQPPKPSNMTSLVHDSSGEEADALTNAFRAKIIRFQDIASGEEVCIDHEGQLYRLRKTRHGKLVLTK